LEIRHLKNDLPLDPKIAGSNPAKAMDFFKDDKNPQYAFLSDGKLNGKVP
jgi:hypothetical protein